MYANCRVMRWFSSQSTTRQLRGFCKATTRLPRGLLQGYYEATTRLLRGYYLPGYYQATTRLLLATTRLLPGAARTSSTQQHQQHQQHPAAPSSTSSTQQHQQQQQPSRVVDEWCETTLFWTSSTKSDVCSRKIRTDEADEAFTSCQLGLDQPSSKSHMSICT